MKRPLFMHLDANRGFDRLIRHRHLLKLRLRNGRAELHPDLISVFFGNPLASGNILHGPIAASLMHGSIQLEYRRS